MSFGTEVAVLFIDNFKTYTDDQNNNSIAKGFLNESTGALQWGFLPNLWPQGNVQRLDNWGWQIQNPNVVLRSIDVPPTVIKKSNESEWDETKLYEIESECSRNLGKVDVNRHLWRDLLETLENVPLRSAPYVNGYPVTADIPRLFIEQYI